MSNIFAERPFPRGALLGAAALIGFTLISVAAVRMDAIATGPTVEPSPVETIAVRFIDRPDGAVVVRHADDDRLLAVLDPGSNGFVRGVLRGLARERKRQGIGMEPAFEISRWEDGHLSLADPTTAQKVELNAFGPTNVGSFTSLLVAGRNGS